VRKLSLGPNPDGGAKPGQLTLKPKDDLASWPDQWHLHMLNRFWPLGRQNNSNHTCKSAFWIWHIFAEKILQGGSGLLILEQDEIHKGLLAVFSNKMHSSNSFQLRDTRRNYILGSFDSYQRN